MHLKLSSNQSEKAEWNKSMRTYKCKTQSTRNAQLTYYSIIKNLLKSILFKDERKQ